MRLVKPKNSAEVSRAGLAGGAKALYWYQKWGRLDNSSVFNVMYPHMAVQAWKAVDTSTIQITAVGSREVVLSISKGCSEAFPMFNVT